MIDDDASPELRALSDRVQRGDELTEAERKEYAELVHQRLLELSTSLRLAASPVVAEMDQIKASVKALEARIEALVEGPDGLTWVPGETTQQLIGDLLDVADLVLIGARWDWDEKEYVAVRERLDQFEDVFSYYERERAEDEAEDRAADEARRAARAS